eukprot:TRINITY_DN77449_c0_g1_i1.p1 TRINITY_DN77449_c0_g1~~TRINITY_DN77449_c0_g1_i1.p1  ORF type:complete len:302 (+),score=35.33 TRINITY_DN77449_c0_g1_i1:76-981(+)
MGRSCAAVPADCCLEGRGGSDGADEKEGILTLPSELVPQNEDLLRSKGERLLVGAMLPQICGVLPEHFRKREYISFDTSCYDLRKSAAGLLRNISECDLTECFPKANEISLEALRANDRFFLSFQARQLLRSFVSKDSAFLADYERLVLEVLCPYLKAKLLEHSDEGAAVAPTRLVYQYPPTLRIQPGPSKSFRRPHRDAEYGHQVGEVNFWMPLTNYSEKTRATLWIESSPNLGDYQPLEIDYGSIAMFHGTLLRHLVPANESMFTRVSMDFRIGVGDYFDPAWSLDGVKMIHGRREVFV